MASRSPSEKVRPKKCVGKIASEKELLFVHLGGRRFTFFIKGGLKNIFFETRIFLIWILFRIFWISEISFVFKFESNSYSYIIFES